MTNIIRTETSTRVTYTIAAEEYNGLGLFTIDHVQGKAILRTPHGLNWTVYSFYESDDLSEVEAVDSLLRPLQVGNIAAYVRFGVGRQIPVGGYVISTNWAMLYPTDISTIQYAAIPGGSLYALQKPEGGLIEALRSGGEAVFKLVANW